MAIVINGSTGISGLTFDTVNVAGNLTVTQSMTANSIADVKGEVRNLPLNSKTASYTLVLSDSGKVVSTNNAVTVPNATFYEGNVISIYNNTSVGGFNVTNARAVTMYLASSNDSNTRNLSARGLATILCVAPNTFIISGVGVS